MLHFPFEFKTNEILVIEEKDAIARVARLLQYLCFWDFSRRGRACIGYCIRSCILFNKKIYVRFINLPTLYQALDTLMEHLQLSLERDSSKCTLLASHQTFS